MYEIEGTVDIERVLNSINVAKHLDAADLDTIGKDVCDGYEIDKRSREGWENKVEEWTKLALQVREPKNTPFDGAANVKYPLITNAALQYSARAYPALITGPNPVRGRVIGFDDKGDKLDKAIRVGKHMSYQLMEEMEDWEEEMDKLLFALPIIGCMFKKTYYDEVKRRNVSEVVYPKELVVNYYAKTLEDASRISHKLCMTENDIRERVLSGLYLDEDLQDRPLLKDENSNTSDAATGINPPGEDDETVEYDLIEQCCYLDLDGDGYKEPYIVTADLTSQKVLRIVARFGEESIDYTQDGDILRIAPDHYYTKYSFIPSPDGSFYDIGFGILLGPINETVNSLTNMLLDAGAINNMQAGFISRGIRVKNGQKPFQLGEWKQVNSAGDDLKKGIVPLPTKEPSNVLFQMLNMMIGAAEKLSSSTEMMSGQIPGQNTKATVAMAAIDQGMKVFMSIHKRVHRSLSKEYKKLYMLNARFLDEDKYFTILDLGEERGAKIQVSDYDPENIDIAPISDPNIATEEQKMAKVQALFELLQMGTVNPAVVTKRYLEATEQPNVNELMQMPEQGPSEEQLQLEWEKEKFAKENELRWEELAIKRLHAEAAGLKMIAEAEAAEEGDQLAEYMQIQKMQQSDDAAGLKSLQLAQQHRQKMAQSDENHQQKMEQQRKQANERQQQSGTSGDQSGSI